MRRGGDGGRLRLPAALVAALVGLLWAGAGTLAAERGRTPAWL